MGPLKVDPNTFLDSKWANDLLASSSVQASAETAALANLIVRIVASGHAATIEAVEGTRREVASSYEPRVAALRLYTTAAYSHINNPLRAGERHCRGNRACRRRSSFKVAPRGASRACEPSEIE